MGGGERESEVDAVMPSSGSTNPVKPDAGIEKPNPKVFNDPVHGHIELHPLCCKIIDTPQFQRLRYLKQLGGVCRVFAGAGHSRFEHSIGVSYLAGQFIEQLQQRQQELNITETEVLCIKVAGLVHDLGHGPLSHLFDRKFLPSVRGAAFKGEHEEFGAKLFDHLIDANDLQSELERWRIGAAELHMIKEMVFGGEADAPCGWDWRGCGSARQFLFEIVANKRHGIDVDKWDYFVRDCRQLGMVHSFDSNRLMKFAKVIDVDGESQICFHEKEVWNVYELFHTRYNLHKRAYQHRVARVVELMQCEALIAANDHLMLRGVDGNQVRMSDAVDDMVAYTALTDNILHVIQFSGSPELAEARGILNLIDQRQLYKFVGEHLLPSGLRTQDSNALRAAIVNKASANSVVNVPAINDGLGLVRKSTRKLEVDDIIISIVNIDYGMKGRNPVDQVHFYNRHSNQAYKIPAERVSCLLPTVYEEQYIRVYARREEALDAAKAAFLSWVAAAVINSGTESPTKKPRKS